MMGRFQSTWCISHLGDEKTRPTGQTAESESITTSRPRVQEALAGASKARRLNCIFNWKILGLCQRRGSNLSVLQEEEGREAYLGVSEGRKPVAPEPCFIPALSPTLSHTMLKKRSASGSTTMRETQEPCARILHTVSSWPSPSTLSPATATRRSPAFIPALSAGSPGSTSHKNCPGTETSSLLSPGSCPCSPRN